jgi:hypothetical protein
MVRQFLNPNYTYNYLISVIPAVLLNLFGIACTLRTMFNITINVQQVLLVLYITVINAYPHCIVLM